MSRGLAATCGFVLLLCAMGAWLVALHAFGRRLAAAHPQVHAALGRPDALRRNTTVTRRAVIAFLVAGRHRRLGDRQVARLGDVVLGSIACTGALGIVAVAMAIAWPPAES